MNVLRSWVVVLMPLLLAFGAIMLTLRGFEPAGEAPLPEEAERPRYELKDAQWTRLDAQGQVAFRGSAAWIGYFDDRSAQMREVRFDQLGGANGPWTITSPMGLVPPKEQRIALTAPVHVAGKLPGAGDVTMDTKSLWIDTVARDIHTDETVHLEGPNRRARADGMRADWAGTRVQLQRNVRIEYAPRS